MISPDRTSWTAALALSVLLQRAGQVLGRLFESTIGGRRLRGAVPLFMICLTAGSASLAEARASGMGVPIIVYHQIVTDNTPATDTIIAEDNFAAQMGYLAANGFTPISLDELVSFMATGRRLPAKPIVLTFDDGWKNVRNALPVLQRYNFKASFWIITGVTGTDAQYLDWSDVREISRNPSFTIGSHTVSHPWDPASNLLTWVAGNNPGKSRVDVRAELLGSRRTLEQHLQLRIHYLAWPCGWYNAELVKMASAAGYTALLTIDSGLNYPGSDRRLIKRTMVNGNCSLASFAKIIEDGIYRDCRGESATSTDSTTQEPQRVEGKL